MSTVTCKVYDKTFTTLLTTETAHASALACEQRRFRVELDDLGGGSGAIHKDHVQAAHVAPRNIVQWLIDGTARFASVIEPDDQETIPASGKPSDAIRQWSGRGLLAILERGAVYPQIGVAKRNTPDHRLFNWTNPDFDDTTWSSAVQIKRQGATTPDQWRFEDPPGSGTIVEAPKGWPDPDAYWIWSQAQGGGSPPQPVGKALFRTTFNVATATDARIFITADDGFRLFIDGALVTEAVRALMWADTSYVDYFLEAGDHTIAIEGENITRPLAASNIAGVICSVIATSNGGATLGTVLARTTSSWKAKGYPASTPGMTFPEIADVLLDEWEARGGPAILRTYEPVAVSAWEQLDVGFPVAETSILDAFRSISQTYQVDLAMSPTGPLTLLAYMSQGSDVSASVNLVRGTHLNRLAHPRKPATLTVGLTRDAYGRYIETVEPTAVTAVDRLEGFISAGGAPSDDAAEAVVDAAFEGRANDVTLYRGRVDTVKGGIVPLDDFTVGDTIKMPNRSLTATNVRVVTIDVSTDVNGHGIFDVEAVP